MSEDEMPIMVTMVIGVLVYTIISFAYMHKTFPTNDMLNMIIKKLDRIESILDKR